MKNGKYYRIRKELIWGMGLLAVLIACTGVFGAVERWRESHTDAGDPVRTGRSGRLLPVRHCPGEPDGILPAV